MKNWSSNIQIYNSMPCFAQPYIVAGETQNSTDYTCKGSERIDDTCIFQYTISGRGVFEHNGREYEVGPGQAFLTHAMDPLMHYYYTENADRLWEFIWLGFLGKFANLATKSMVARYGNIFKLELDSEIIKRLLSLKKQNPIEMTSTQGAGLIAELFEELENSVIEQRQSSSAISSIRKAQKMINEMKDFRNFSVNKLADELGLSREHLSRLFKQQVEISINEYLVRHKMHMASRLLKDSNLSNKEIANKLGYSGQANFSRCFKKLFSMSPTQFKNSGATSFKY